MAIHFATENAGIMSANQICQAITKIMTAAGGSATLNPSDAYIEGTVTFAGADHKIDAAISGMDGDIVGAWDDGSHTLVLYSGSRAPTDTFGTTSTVNRYVFAIFANGSMWWTPDNKLLDGVFNIGEVTVKPASSTMRATLTPLVIGGEDFTPMFISLNGVIDTAGTTVTDTAGNTFVSLGNLLYIRDTAASEPAGTAVTCRVGSVSTLPAGAQATVTNSGTLNDIVLDFGIPAGAAGPKGDKGDKGAKGDKGDKGEAGTGTRAVAIADLTSAPTAGDFNALLNALRAAGLMDRPTPAPKVPVKSISISPSSPTVKEHGTVRLSATVKPDNATDKTISWSSGDKQTATVTSDGTVTGIKQGSTNITATANDGSKVSSSVTLTVASVQAQTETVDVFIGDSTTAVWATAPEEKNWTTLIANADGVGRVNVASNGAGFQNVGDSGKTLSGQVTEAVGKTQGKTVRRVFLVGLWNDQDDIKSNPSAEMTAMTETADAIKSAWPGAQLLYIPEVAPQTEFSQSVVQGFSSAINQAYQLFEGKGFNVARNWFDWMPDGKTNGYMHDNIHPNAKAMNVAAHKIREWVNTLSGPKITGEIPAWSE